MKNKLLRLQLLLQRVMVIIFVVFILVGLFSNALASNLSSNGSIEYLKPIELKVSANGINRLNFGQERVVKTVGDSSRYSIILSDNGSDLFLTSKVPAKEIIDLTLLTARNESVDLRLHVTNSSSGSIIKVNLAGKNIKEDKEREEISLMINAMKLYSKSKYYVEERKRVVKIPSKRVISLNQYVSYRYGDLMGAGFVYKGKGSPMLDKEDLRKTFKDILATSFDRNTKEWRVFVIFKGGEGIDV